VLAQGCRQGGALLDCAVLPAGVVTLYQQSGHAHQRATLTLTLACCLAATMQGLEQSSLLQRLGPARLYNPAHASCHWVLDLSHPGHEEVARKLVSGGGHGLQSSATPGCCHNQALPAACKCQVALASGPASSSSSSSNKDKGDEAALPNWWNLRLRGE
jgi:hypothetical protein